jgi:hypothetical protein
VCRFSKPVEASSAKLPEGFTWWLFLSENLGFSSIVKGDFPQLRYLIVTAFFPSDMKISLVIMQSSLGGADE